MAATASERVAALVREIDEAFADVEYPGDEKLVYDSSGKHLECAEVADALRGRNWRKLSAGELRYSPSNLHFMTPEAVHYYLPAYLRASVLSYDEVAAVPETLLRILKAPPGTGTNERRTLASLTDRLTPRQKAVIRSFLEFLRDEHGADFPWDDISPAAVLGVWR